MTVTVCDAVNGIDFSNFSNFSVTKVSTEGSKKAP